VGFCGLIVLFFFLVLGWPWGSGLGGGGRGGRGGVGGLRGVWGVGGRGGGVLFGFGLLWGGGVWVLLP